MKVWKYAAYTAVLVSLATLGWNGTGALALGDVEEDYRGEIFRGELAGSRLTTAAIEDTRSWIEERTRPTLNPITVWKEQVRYNASTSGYDLALRLEPSGPFDPSRKSYFVYQRANVIFLRQETSGKNRVLIATFSPTELMETIQPNLMTDE